ncbi:FAD-dependent monooxygenase [Nocardia spumae]|uniref:FAD-dependent monooxygenase n=1 Tax=Nocardia spumae TaxID=2887190 RepID=UPI001D153AB2|nr:FAD-dependent monooxygenase [Nocardia spumae]
MRADPNTRRAVVVGAGIGGLAAAVALSRRGWAVEILERSAAIGESGSGLTLWCNGLRALDSIGLGAEVRARAMPETDAGIRNPRGRWLIRTDTAELTRRYGEVVMIPRSDLFDILRGAVAGLGIRTSIAVTGIEADGDRITVRHGAGASHSDLVVGADGIHSVVREWVCPQAAPPRYTGLTAWRMITARPVPALREGGQSWGNGQQAGVIPLPDGRVYVFGAAAAPAGQRSPGNELGELRRRFGHWHEPIPALLDAVGEDDVLRHDIYHLPPLRTFARGRAAVLGDAAHAMTPNMGQGANQAIEDAVTLAALLDRTGEIGAALVEYDRIRRPRTRRIAQRSRRIGRIAQLSSVPALGRDAALLVTPGSVLLRGLGPALSWQPPR